MENLSFTNHKPFLALAPMAGVTDLPFRLLCKSHGADLLYSEMISATGLFYNPKASLALAKSMSEDSPLFLQLFGNQPKHFAHAARLISELGNNSTLRRPEGLDINFGCPVKKVVKQGAGCALMKNPDLSREIIKSVIENTDLSVSIKIRAGIENYTAIKWIEHVADLDWKIIMVHGRTYAQGFSGEIDYELIKKIKSLYPHKTVIANGGILSPENAKDILEKTSADGLGIARGAWGNPWIFEQTKDYLKTGSYSTPSLEEIKKTALSHSQLFFKHFPQNSLVEMRKHLAWYFKGQPNAKDLRQKLLSIKNVEEVKKVLYC